MQKKIASVNQFLVLSLGALGVVFGDIGTSPLYAVRVCFTAIPLNLLNILGVLSLIFWSLIIVISIKYLIIFLRVDNHGEGGTIALLALIKEKKFSKKIFVILSYLGLIGTSLLFSDGMITPAISVVSAVEGLTIVSPHLNDLVVPLTFVILLGLFFFQSRGSGHVGRTFAPIMIIWFVTIGYLGLIHIMQNPVVLCAFNPWYAILLFKHYHLHSLLVLMGVFLVVTGGEALYADIGYFGRNPIRFTWFTFVLPALILNYFGQGANLLIHPEHLKNPFYFLAPQEYLYPLIILATLSTIIASQAMISAVSSLAKQAITLQLLPKLKVIYTSYEMNGQVYVPAVNWITCIGTLGLVIIFKHSDNLANAYGLAVNMVMLIMSIMASFILYRIKNWALHWVLMIMLPMIVIESVFLSGNFLKIFHNGWLPILFATVGAIILFTWKDGLKLLSQASTRKKVSMKAIARKAASSDIIKIPGIAVFINEPYDKSKNCLFHQIEFSKTIHEVTVVLDIKIRDYPIVKPQKRIKTNKLLHGIRYIKMHFGYMESVDIPLTLRQCEELKDLPFLSNAEHIIYYLEIVNGHINDKYNVKVPLWKKKLFIKMLNNFTQNVGFYHLPIDQTIVIGTFYEI